MINYTTKQLERLYEADKCIMGDDSMVDVLEVKKGQTTGDKKANN